MNKKKVFISGPMSGYENYNREAFEKAEKELVQAGFSVFNPAWLLFDESWTHYDIMAIDLAALERCDYIYQLDGWENSKGAMEEWTFSRVNGIKVLHRYELSYIVDKTYEDKRDLVAEYCANDILDTEALFDRFGSKICFSDKGYDEYFAEGNL